LYLQGLFKARKLLSEDFGNVHVHFGEPLSIRKFTDGKVDRSGNCGQSKLLDTII
jgi:glycerone phosphate O-acyltransferase